MQFEFEAELWLYPGKDGWHFLTLPDGVADAIREDNEGRHRAFGSLAVEARIGATDFSTSVFSDKKSGSYLLPVKAEVRRRENLTDGDRVTVELELR